MSVQTCAATVMGVVGVGGLVVRGGGGFGGEGGGGMSVQTCGATVMGVVVRGTFWRTVQQPKGCKPLNSDSIRRNVELIRKATRSCTNKPLVLSF